MDFALFALLLGGSFLTEAATNSTPGQLAGREVFLGKLPIGAQLSASALSEDCQHVAIPCQRGLRWTVQHDGTMGDSYQRVHSLTFSPKGGRLAYVGQKSGGGEVLVLDGKEGPTYNNGIPTNSLKFSPDGLRYSYAIAMSNSNPELKIPYDVDEHGASAVRPNSTGGRRWVWGGPARVVLDGKESRDYYSLATRKLLFSPDGKQLAYHASLSPVPTLEDLGVVVRNGIESKPYQHILEGTPVFSPDSGRFAFAGTRDGKWFVVLDDKEGPPYDGVISASLTFSPDSRRFVYIAKRDGRCFLVVDGKETSPVQDGEFSIVTFSPDSQRMALLAGRDSRSYWLIDGKQGPAFDRVSLLSFSPDSQRVTYVGYRGKQAHIVTDGIESRGYELVGESPSPFSPDSHHVAYLAMRDGKYRLVLDGKEGADFDLAGPALAFSPDSRHVAFVAGRGPIAPGNIPKTAFVVIDGRESRQYIGIFPGLAFAGNNVVRVIALRLNEQTAEFEIVRVELSVPET